MTQSTENEQIDLALVKRDAAQQYTRKRYALRLAVSIGAISTAEARSKRYECIEHKTTWRAARALLKSVRS